MRNIKQKFNVILVVVLVFSLSNFALAAENDEDFVVVDGVLTQYTGNATDVVIPDNLGITSIGDKAFMNCTGITSVTVPEGVTAIGDEAFADCSDLVSVSLPESIRAIGNWAFRACWSLASIEIPDGITEINEGTFSTCGALTCIAIPETVIAIRTQAFDGCYGLKTVAIPESVIEIGDSAFSNCSGFTSFCFPAGTTAIPPRALCCCGALASVTILDGVTEIGEAAFYGCDSLKFVLIPDSVTEIGNGAFSAVGRDGNIKTGLMLEGSKGSCAEQFAEENSIPFTSIIISKPAQYTLLVDDMNFSLWAYEIDGNPYFKLRDLAMALNGTEKQFGIEWDGEYNEVTFGNTPYTPVGDELSEPTKAGPAAASISSTFFWGNSLCSYIVEGWHYIKLSDLAASLKFSASCDEETHTAVIDTSDNTMNIPKSTGQAKLINNIALMNADYSWTINGNGNVILSYNADDRDSKVLTPVTVEQNGSGEYIHTDTYPGVFMSEEKTAIAYGAYYGGPLYVTCSDDKGKTWSKPVMIQDSVGVSSLYIGFLTPDDGYLVIGNFHGMGSEDNFVYLTNDGGRTWTQTGNPNELYARMLTGAGFSNDEIGFLSFRFEFSDFSPAICRTLDGGRTWEKLQITLPKDFDQYYSKTPLSPVFNGENGVFPIECRLADYEGTRKTIYLTSTDCGKTWTYDEKYNLARIWAEALKTRDGKQRYDIMSANMQAKFRERQQIVNDDPESFVIHSLDPQTDRYDIAMDGDNAIITYWYTDAYDNQYKGAERLSFGEENDRTLVATCIPETEFTELTLYNQKLPILDESQVTEVVFEGTIINGITQGFYHSDAKSEVGNEFYSYLSIGGIKYDLGYVGYDLGSGQDMLNFYGLTTTKIKSDTPVYQQVRVYGLTALESSYLTIRNNVPYLLYNMQGIGSQYNLDGDGDVETISNAGTTLFPANCLYEWYMQAGTIDLLPLTEALGCDEAAYDPDENLIHTFNFIYYDKGGESGPPDEGPSYRYLAGRLIQTEVENRVVHKGFDGGKVSVPESSIYSPDGSFTAWANVQENLKDENGQFYSIYQVLFYNTQTGNVTVFDIVGRDFHFLWSEDCKFLAVTYSGREWTHFSIVDTAALTEMPGPYMTSVMKQFEAQGKAFDYTANETRPDPALTPVKWLPDGSKILISYEWHDKTYTTQSGTFVYDVKSGDVSELVQSTPFQAD